MPVAQLNVRQIDLSNPDHIKRLVTEIDGEQNRERKRNAWIAAQVRHDNQMEYVKKEIARLYPKTHNNFRHGNIKVAKKIVEKVSKAYKQKPARKLEKETDTVELNEFYDTYNFHRAFKEADEIFNLHKYVFMWLAWQNPSESNDNHTIEVEEGRYVLHALAPYEYDIVRDQVTGEPLVFILSYPEQEVTQLAGGADGVEQTISESQSDTAAQTTLYKFWSPTQKVEVRVKKSKGHGNEVKDTMTLDYMVNEENLLGRLVGGYLQSDTSVDYPVGGDIAVSSIDWNVAFSDLKTAAATQGHGQLVLSVPEGKEQQKLHMGMHTAITLSQSKKPDVAPSTAEYISASPDLAGQLDILKFDLSQILDDEGIRAKGVVQGGVDNFSSGFDRLLADADVQDRVEDNQSLYADGLEQEVFLTLKAYEEAMNSKSFSKAERLEVHFEKPKVLISDKETLENIDKRDKLGTLLSYEKHMILNPNLTKEQAIAREEEIQAEHKQRQEEMLTLMEGQDEELDEEGNPIQTEEKEEDE